MTDWVAEASFAEWRWMDGGGGWMVVVELHLQSADTLCAAGWLAGTAVTVAVLVRLWRRVVLVVVAASKNGDERNKLLTKTIGGEGKEESYRVAFICSRLEGITF